jgi:hypothetical protein
MTVIIDLSTPEKFAQFEKVYAKALTQHLKDDKPIDLETIAKEAGVVEPEKPAPQAP